MKQHAAVVGAGVIGSAWAARFALHGIDVKVSDPNPDAPRIIDEVLGNARSAWADLGLPRPAEGTVTLVGSLAEAVDGAGHIQESAPEDPAIKVPILEQIAAACPPETVIASSTSGIKPSELQPTIANPERLVVGHPYNPVYLIPVVEVVGGELTSDTAVAKAIAMYEAISMKPVHVRVEIDAFIGDRLLEAVWREALWLVNDGVATTEEIDDVIRFGFGLRWRRWACSRPIGSPVAKEGWLISSASSVRVSSGRGPSWWTYPSSPRNWSTGSPISQMPNPALVRSASSNASVIATWPASCEPSRATTGGPA